MYKELCLYHINQDLEQTRLQDQVSEAVKLTKLDAVTTHPNALKCLKDILPPSVALGCVIDFPFGVLSPEVRKLAVASAIKDGAKIIDLVAPYSLIQPGLIDEFRGDIESIVGMCFDNSVEPRLMIDYRLHFKSITIATCNTAKQCGFTFISPSTGTYSDDIFDNLIIAKQIEKEAKLKCILSGHILKSAHWAVVEASGVYGARFYSLNMMKHVFGV
jgi:deoxyribose-phosphate aldolase